MIEFNKKNENPFSGLEACLTLFGSTRVDDSLLTAAFEEVKDDHTKREMFYSLLFSIGDITNRDHNIFHHDKVDSGGQSRREDFYIIMNWMIEHDYEQFKKFLFAGLFDEYTCFDHLFRNRVVTSGSDKAEIKKVYSMLSVPRYTDDLADYVVSIVNGNNPFKKHLVAKFLTIPRMGKRSKHNKMLPETYYRMRAKANFLKLVSDKVGWSYIYTPGFVNFTGYRAWRKQYNQDLESVLFSTNKISEFNKVEFIEWLNKLPANARGRVYNRLFLQSNGKWTNLREYYREWESAKQKAQREQRELEEKMRNGLASVEDEERLKEVKKLAKVNIGGTSFKDLYDDICVNKVDELKLQAFIDKINLPFNFLTIIDDSGSMTGAPFNFASFLVSALLYKNPNDFGRNMIGMFSDNCRFYSTIDMKADHPDRHWWSAPNIKHIAPEPFVVPEKSFYENYQRIRQFLNAAFVGNGTYIDSIGNKISEIASTNPDILDDIKRYPVWCIVSDGDFNNSRNAKESLIELQKVCKEKLGFLPFIVLIEICSEWGVDASKFAGVQQFMYVPGKVEIIEQILTNFLDVDQIDGYTPLLSLYKSNRYAPVRKNVL